MRAISILLGILMILTSPIVSVGLPPMVEVCSSMTSISAASPPAGIAGASYSFQVVASGEQPLSFSIVSGSPPPGLSINPASGVIAGIPTTPGSYNFTVHVQSSCSAPYGASAERAYTISIGCQAPIISSPPTLPSGTGGQAYSYQLISSGGYPPITYTTLSTCMPGLNVSSSGLVSGIPLVGVNNTFLIRATDSCPASAGGPQSIDGSFFISVTCPAFSIISPTTLSAKQGEPYSAQIQTSGGVQPVSFSVQSGSLPPGLSLSPTGQITGTPSLIGQYPITVRATSRCYTSMDWMSPGPACFGANPQYVDQLITLNVGCPNLAFSPISLFTSGTQGQPYSFQIQSSGGQFPVTYSIVSGSLPPGLHLSSSGLIAGTPTTAGNYSFVIMANDSCSLGEQSVQQSFSLNVTPASCPALNFITSSSLLSGTAGQTYSLQMQTSGGQTPVVYLITSGSLPPGLIMNSSGLIRGIPSTAGLFSFTLTAADNCAGGAQNLSKTFSLTINPASSAAPIPAPVPAPTPSPVSLNITVSPGSFTIPKGTAVTQILTYSIFATQPITETLISPKAAFFAGNTLIGEVNVPVTAFLANGIGTVSETINIPFAISRRAENLGVTQITFVREFVTSGVSAQARKAGQASVAAMVPVTITTAGSSELRILSLRIYFENNRAEITIGRNDPLKAFAEIRYDGSGLLQGYWEVDGRRISDVFMHLVFGKDLTLVTPEIPPLPTFVAGTHVIRLVITNPAGVVLPEAIYFVTLDEAPRFSLINILEPSNGAEIDYSPMLFRWDSWKNVSVYRLEFREINSGESIFNVYTKKTEYQLVDSNLRRFFRSDTEYYWKVIGVDADNKIAGESPIFTFKFKGNSAEGNRGE
jgi:hypothetical protein